VARAADRVDHGAVQYTSASFLVGPLIAFAVVGLFVLLLRWTFRRGTSVVARTPQQGRVDEYGLLVSVAAPPNYIEAEIVRLALEDAGIKATLAQTLAGPRLMVFPEDEARARKVVDQRR
jgi:hypothetical protein